MREGLGKREIGDTSQFMSCKRRNLAGGSKPHSSIRYVSDLFRICDWRVERCRQLLSQTPNDWQSIAVLKSK
jgi:hypothetical protein